MATPKDGDAATPTQASTDAEAKKDKEPPPPTTSRMSFFGLGFLRARTAQTPSVRAVPEEPEPSSASASVGEVAANGGHANGTANGRAVPDADGNAGASKAVDGEGVGETSKVEKTLDGEPVVASPLAASG